MIGEDSDSNKVRNNESDKEITIKESISVQTTNKRCKKECDANNISIIKLTKIIE